MTSCRRADSGGNRHLPSAAIRLRIRLEPMWEQCTGPHCPIVVHRIENQRYLSICRPKTGCHGFSGTIHPGTEWRIATRCCPRRSTNAYRWQPVLLENKFQTVGIPLTGKPVFQTSDTRLSCFLPTVRWLTEMQVKMMGNGSHRPRTEAYRLPAGPNGAGTPAPTERQNSCIGNNIG